MPRDGLLVRNAADVGSELDLAEPDALDFNLLSNFRYGVLRGCDTALTGWNVNVGAGLVVNNGVVQAVGGQVTLSTASTSPRFDLVGIDTTGGLPVKIQGLPSANPVFPDFGDNFVVLASVYIKPGSTPPSTTDLTDKRIIVPERYVTALDSGTLLGSYDTSSVAPKFTIDHQGKQEWNGDTRLYRTSVGTLTTDGNVNVGNTVTAPVGNFWAAITSQGDVVTQNIIVGNGPPSANAVNGAIYQDRTNGGIYAFSWTSGWQSIATATGIVPTGSVMATMLSAAPAGWLLLNGQQVDQATAGGLWTAFPQWQVSTASGLRLKLPDYRGAFLRQGNPGQTGGSVSVALSKDNLPAHTHLMAAGPMQPGGAHSHIATSMGTAGAHGHQTAANGGEHDHPIPDPGHFHAGADGVGGGSFIAMVWGGRRRIDGPFNDASHPVAVQEVANTVRAFTGITKTALAGAHTHWTDTQGWHTHPLTLSSTTADHTHAMNEQSVGGNVPVPLLPPFGTVNWLIKT